MVPHRRGYHRRYHSEGSVDALRVLFMRPRPSAVARKFGAVLSCAEPYRVGRVQPCKQTSQVSTGEPPREGLSQPVDSDPEIGRAELRGCGGRGSHWGQHIELYESGLPLSRCSTSEIASEAIRRGIVAEISGARKPLELHAIDMGSDHASRISITPGTGLSTGSGRPRICGRGDCEGDRHVTTRRRLAHVRPGGVLVC